MALPTLAPSDPTESEPSGRPQPKREHLVLAAVAVVALLAGGWFFFLRSSGDSTPPPVLHKPIVHATGAAGAAAKPGTAVAGKPAAAAGKPTAAPAAATTAPVSELAAYVAKANAICTTANAKDKAIDNSDTSVKGEIAVLDQELPLMNGVVAAHKALAVPAGHPEFAKLWDQEHQIASLMHQMRGALNDGNPNTFVQLTAWAQQDVKTLDTAYTAAGLTACAAD